MHRLTVRAEKTYSAVERIGDHPVDTILQKLLLPGFAKDPCPKFKEWSSDRKSLEFTLATMMPPVPSIIVFGPFNFEREPARIARCITAELMCDKYGVHVEPGGVYIPISLVVLSCLESLRILTTADLILWFHIVDWYRGKVKLAWWLELIITCFTNYPRIRLLDEWIHTFESPLSPKAALGTLDVWTEANKDNRAMARSVCQDLAAIQGRTPRVCPPSDNGSGRDIVYPGALYPNLVDYTSYDVKDFLQAEGDMALACPADLGTKSAGYNLRECVKELIFSLRPQVGEVLPIPHEITDNSTQSAYVGSPSE